MERRTNERLYFHPPRVTVEEVLTNGQMRQCVELQECSVTRVSQLRKMIHDGSMVTLFALADYVRPGEEERVRRGIVGSLLAPVFIADHAVDDDIDRGKWDGRQLCEVADVFASFEGDEDVENNIIHRLIAELLERRERYQFQVARLVLPLRDQHLQNTLRTLGFGEGCQRDEQISMVHVNGVSD